MNTPTATLLVMCFSLLLSTLSTAQNTSSNSTTPTIAVANHECGTKTSATDMANLRSNWQNNQHTETQFLNSFNSEASTPIMNIPIKAHIIRTTAGTGGYSMANLNAAVALMNTYYANANMQFFLCGGVNYIDNSTYYDFDSNDEAAMTAAHNVSDNINIYFANSASIGSSAVCGYAYYPGGPNTIIMANSCANNGSTLSHEMGHFYSIIHTHGGSSNELVNGSNCTTEGDELCDTPADPNLSGLVNGSCVYTGSALDANNQAYTPNTNNIMAYSRKSCRTMFTAGQYARINATALNHVDRQNYKCASVSEDAAIAGILNPVDNGTFCTTPFIPEVVIENLSLNKLNAVTINYQIDNGPISTFAWTGSLATGGLDTVALPTLTIPANINFTFRAFTSNPNTIVDNNTTNDTTTVSSQYLPLSGTDTRTECISYTWIDGNSYNTNNTTAIHNLVGGANNGCDSIVTLNLTVNTVDVSTNTTINTIAANATVATYRWLDCANNFAVIPGEINQQYAISTSGNYAVEVTQNNCIDTSACNNMTFVGIGENSFGNQVYIYPNPNKGLVNIDLGNLTNVGIKVLSIAGQVVHFNTNIKKKHYQFELNEANGTYFIELTSGEITERFKLIKK